MAKVCIYMHAGWRSPLTLSQLVVPRAHVLHAPREADELLVALEQAGVTAGTWTTDSDLLVRGGRVLLWTPGASTLLELRPGDVASTLGVSEAQVSCLCTHNVRGQLSFHTHHHLPYTHSYSTLLSLQAATTLGDCIRSESSVPPACSSSMGQPKGCVAAHTPM